MRYAVFLTADAELDLQELYEYIAEHDSPAAAERVLDRLLEVTSSLAVDPKRGTVPKELRELGLQEFRQAFFKPYRVIYRLADRQVFVLVIADGRRELSLLLARRLLGAVERG